MSKRSPTLFAISLLLVLFSATACFSGTNLQGQKTPAVPVGGSNTYAYVQKDQVWLALHGAAATQITNFKYGSEQDHHTQYWQGAIWSPGNHYIAFTVSSYGSGIGGGGCPSPDYTAGALVIYNLESKELSYITNDKINPTTADAAAPAGSWRYFFWQDDTHLVLWDNNSEQMGVYRADLGTRQVSRILTTDKMAGLANIRTETIRDIRYAQNALYYEVIEEPYTDHSKYVLYRQPLEGNGQKVIQMGTSNWCNSESAFPRYMKAGWDVSSDGKSLAYQSFNTVTNEAPPSIKLYDLTTGQDKGTLFDQIPTSGKDSNAHLSWSPNSQLVTLSGIYGYNSANQGPYSENVLSKETRDYQPISIGEVVWTPDSSTFAMVSSETTGTNVVDQYKVLEDKGNAILFDAQQFSWGA